VYQVEFGRATHLDGIENPGATPSTGSYGLSSVCRPGGCVATAAKWSGDASFAPSVVFDQVGDSWVAVAVTPGQCNGHAAETWEVFTLRPRPDGSLAGEHIRMTSDSCAEKAPVTFTRTGDVDLDADLTALPDPAKLPPRVLTPAEGLRGRYAIVRTFAGRVPYALGELSVTTYCLRTGDRCMSYFSFAGGDIPLVFGDGNWVWTNNNEGPCSRGPSQLDARAQIPLPVPAENPIPVLSGHGTWVQTGGCAATTTFEETYTRTGD
jgi:serine/threonine-protein kinase